VAGADLALVRQEYAETIRSAVGLRSEALVRALATVPREAFVGPGPWQILRLEALARGYEATPDNDPRHLYQRVLVALDPERGLNNGEPASLAAWLDALDLRPGDRLLHVGCGVGYYTAIAAEAILPAGRAVGIEVDPALAARASENLARYRHVEVTAGDGCSAVPGSFDALFVNAGATEPMPAWLDALREGGRLLLPLTADVPGQRYGVGFMWRIERARAGLRARCVSPVGVYPCLGARTQEGSERLLAAYRRGGQERVSRLRRDAHESGARCWLHAPRFCLSAD
jgi:protein-L-isoaspartate(D-aspartate) O-methyltransferase